MARDCELKLSFNLPELPPVAEALEDAQELLEHTPAPGKS